jgi:hypothetical protein
MNMSHTSLKVRLGGLSSERLRWTRPEILGGVVFYPKEQATTLPFALKPTETACAPERVFDILPVQNATIGKDGSDSKGIL